MSNACKTYGTVFGAAFVVFLTFCNYVVAQTCVPPPADLVSWWPGDGNADDIANGNDGALEEGATFATGKVGQAFLLDGVDDFVDLGNGPNLHVSAGDFTVDAWVLLNALSHPPGTNGWRPAGDMSIVDKMANNGGPDNSDGWRLLKFDNNRFWFCFGAGVNQCDAFFGSGYTVSSTTRAVPGVWFHIAAVKSATSLSIYVNGQLEDTRSPVPDFVDTNSANLLIGANAQYGAHLNGLVDEVEIYNRALTPEEIQAIFNAGAAGKCKVTTVVIDIKPGSFPASINPRSRGRIPVAILTTDTFDATTVDPATALFGRTGAEAAPVHAALEDVNGDAKADLVLHFSTQATGIRCGDIAAFLTGDTRDGHTIEGADSIQTVGCE